jgi:hypothetical protein
MAQTTDSRKLLFVVGLWRSGTSLVHALLNQHPRVRLMYEAEPFDLWPRAPGAVWPADWAQRLEFFNQTLSRHQLSPPDLPLRVPAREAALSLYRTFGEQRGAVIIGEKAPAYHAYLPEIGGIFPEARFVIIWRDPLACCRSAARAAHQNRFFAHPGMMSRILSGAETMARGVEQLQRNRVRVHEVVYPEFVGAPEDHLRRICDFAEIPFDPKMLNLKDADVSVLPGGEHHLGVRSGVIAASQKQDDPLPAAFTAKAARYGALWREQFAHLGFARALEAKTQTIKPGRAEQWSDRRKNSARRMADNLKRRLFRRLPLNWWGRLRSGTRRGQAVEAETAP